MITSTKAEDSPPSAFSIAPHILFCYDRHNKCYDERRKTMAQEYPIVTNQNETFMVEMEWRDASDNLISLQNYKAKMQVRDPKNKALLILDLSTDNGRITFDNDAIIIKVPTTTMQGVKAGKYAYDLQLIDTAKNITYVIVGGTFTVKEGITQ